GIELANGFAELADAGEQRKRLEQQMAEKDRIYGERYPIDEDLLNALSVMPDACGVALGFERLVMLATGAAHIAEGGGKPIPAPRTTTGTRGTNGGDFPQRYRCLAPKRQGCARRKGTRMGNPTSRPARGEHQQSWYRKLNRRAVVPTAPKLGQRLRRS